MKAEDIVTTAPPDEMNHHHVVRDGSVWWCRFCKSTWPYPSPVPESAGPCIKRKWTA